MATLSVNFGSLFSAGIVFSNLFYKKKHCNKIIKKAHTYLFRSYKDARLRLMTGPTFLRCHILAMLLCFYTRVLILNLMFAFLPWKLWINCINLNVKRDITLLWKFDGLRGRFNKDVRTAEDCWGVVGELIHFHGVLGFMQGVFYWFDSIFCISLYIKILILTFYRIGIIF